MFQEQLDPQILDYKQMQVQVQNKAKRNLEIVADPLPMPLLVPTYKDNHLVIPEGVDLSKIVFGKQFPMFPPPMIPLMGVHPLLAVEFVKYKQYTSQMNTPFLSVPPNFQVRMPCFEANTKTEKQFISVKTLQTLYECLFYFYDVNYSLHIAEIIYSTCSINHHQSQQNISYYSNRKNQLVCEFIQNIHLGSTNTLATSLQGLGIRTFNRNKQEIIHFTPQQSSIEYKVSKKNWNEFQEMYQIAKGEFVNITYNLQNYIGYIKQTSPIIIVCPWIKSQEHFKCAITKIVNKRIYDKITQAMIDVSLDMSLLTSQNIQLFWELPGTSRSFLFETVVEWANKDYNVLIVSPTPDSISEELDSFRVRYIKLNSRMDERFINQSNSKIIVASVSSCCAESLKSVMFTHVIIDQANQVSEVMSLMAISKGCQHLVMIGDFNKNKPISISKLAVSKGISISLFERMANSGSPILCYNNQRRIHSSIANYISNKFYDNILTTSKQEQFMPTIKGFPWPSQDIRICLINIPSPTSQQLPTSIPQAQTITKIVIDIIKAGYTKLHDISIIAESQQQRTLIHNFLRRTIKPLISYYQEKQKQTRIAEAVTTFNDNKNSNKDLILLNSVGEEEGGPERLNVAMSKAMKGFILVGDIGRMVGRREYRELVAYANNQKLIYRIS